MTSDHHACAARHVEHAGPALLRRPGTRSPATGACSRTGPCSCRRGRRSNACRTSCCACSGRSSASAAHLRLRLRRAGEGRQATRRGLGLAPRRVSRGDQHAGYELDAHGKRICAKDGMAVDLCVGTQRGRRCARGFSADCRSTGCTSTAAIGPSPQLGARSHQAGDRDAAAFASGALMPKVVVKGRAG